ncbi:MAG: RNA polymerase-binding transcription factor DksA [Paraglaciecola sp.]|jgi:RNA polymerase-binding transcription factor DksA
MNLQPIVVRYSNIDLEKFKAIIEKELEKSNDQLHSSNQQIANLVEKIEEEGDWMEDSGSQTDLEMFRTMVNRQLRQISNLQNALTRIHNKSFGICTVTGELIDKRRLIAVPTTGRSLAAENAMQITEEENAKRRS